MHYSERLEPPEHAPCAGAVRDDRPLRDLQAQPARVDAGLGQGRGRRVHHVAARELSRRQVHRQPDFLLERARHAPTRVVAARMREHEVAEFVDHPGVLRDADELAGGHEAALRMLPAHERLEPRHPARGELDLRLVGDPQLVLVERGAQLGLELLPLRRARAQRLAEDLVTGAAALLRAVHREVGVMDQRVGIRSALEGERDPDAARERHLAPRDLERRRRAPSSPAARAARRRGGCRASLRAR